MTRTSHKLRGAAPGKESQLARLKRLPPQQREEICAWRDEQPTLTNAQIRDRIKARFGIDLRNDGRMSEFWDWQFQQAERQPKDQLDLALYDLGERLQREFRAWREELRQQLAKQ